MEMKARVEKMPQLEKLNLPVHKHTTASVECLLNEFIGLGKVLEQILVFDIVDLYYEVFERTEQGLVQGQAQGRKYMCDSSLFQCIFTAQGEQPENSLSQS